MNKLQSSYPRSLLSADRRAGASFAAPLAYAYLRHGRSQGEREDYDDDDEEERNKTMNREDMVLTRGR
jgi:hypothetical protein